MTKRNVVRLGGGLFFISFWLFGCGGSPPPVLPEQQGSSKCVVGAPGDASVINEMETMLDAKSLTSAGAEVSASLKVLAPPASGPGSTVQYDRRSIDALVRELRVQPLVPRESGGYGPIKYDQFRNDCEDRAHVAASYILATRPGLLTGKIFIGGNLSMFDGNITWGYHVAPYVVLLGPDKKVQHVLVIDPAIDGERAITVPEWLKAATSSSKPGSNIIAYLTRVESWNFVYGQAGKPGVPEDGTKRAFCGGVKDARQNLATFARRAPNVVTYLKNVSVEKVDADKGLVIFRGRSKTYGPFAAREDLIETLSAVRSKKQRVNVKRQRLYTDNRFKNFWRFLFGGLEAVQAVEVLGEPPSESEESERSEPMPNSDV